MAAASRSRWRGTSRREAAQGRHQHRHHDGAKPQDRAFDRGAFRRVTPGSKLIDVFKHDDTRLNRNSKERQEPTPDETLKYVPVTKRASKPPTRAMATLRRISSAHLKERNML